MNYPKTVSETHFIKLKLNQGDQLLSENFYWRGKEYLNYKALEDMEKASLTANATISKTGSDNRIVVSLTNESSIIALATRLKLVQETTGKRVLPAFYEDNYFPLLPGESRTLSIEYDERYLEEDSPQLMIEGWNLESGKIQINGK